MRKLDRFTIRKQLDVELSEGVKGAWPRKNATCGRLVIGPD